LLLYSLVLGLSLGMVVLKPAPLAVLYVVLGLALLRALLEWSLRYRDLRRVLPIPRESPWITWPAVVVLLALPWTVDGWLPSREAMTWTLLGIGALAVTSTAGLVLTSFDLAHWDRTVEANTPPSVDERLGGENDEARRSKDAGTRRDIGAQGVRRSS
jgi:hypothetical protein